MTKKELRQKLLKYYQKNIDKKINNRIMPYKFIDLYALGLKDNNFFALAMNELSHSTHYDVGDRLVMHDRDILYGFKSLTDNEIEGYFSQRDFLDWLEGQRVSDYDVI